MCLGSSWIPIPPVHWVTQAPGGLGVPQCSLSGGQPLFNEKPLERALKRTLESLLSLPHAAASQHLKSVVAQLFPPKWSLWFLWHSFVDSSPLNSSREAAERDLAWPMFLTSWDNIFIPGWSGSALLDSDHSPSGNSRPCLVPIN